MSEMVCVVPRTNALGEGPVWDAARGRLYWVDIKGGRLEWFEPETGADGGVDLEVQTTSVVPRANGIGFLAAARPGLGVLDPDTGAFELKIEVEADRPDNRPNDGNVDLGGRYWFGTMHESYGRFEGALYRLDPDWTLTRCITGMGIPNTLVCSPDGRRLYIADSTRLTLEMASIDPETGALGRVEPFADTQGQSYGPDGSAVDAEGFLWNCQWGGSRIVRYAPDGGVDKVVPLPVTNPTSCAFGGAGLDTLYITSARETLSAETLAREPWSGSLMAFKPGVKGLALPPFAG
ncbi:MAG: SMP-30/gluconolactonase/LRE family protein [Caulobacteraceae bacterium]|nr:SMP-30/gluconolactonase/LRE family protein [Caulobacteraceae bacterium]